MQYWQGWDSLHNLLHDSSTYTTEDIEEEKSLWTPHRLKYTSKHPQGKHIEEEVREVTMHKQIGKELKKIEIMGFKKVKSQHIVQVNTKASIYDHRRKETEGIDDNEIFGYGWRIVHSSKLCPIN